MTTLATLPDATTDSCLECPRCGYNLTGLPQPRCPECGLHFDWDALRRQQHPGPQLAFERARGWRKLPALLLTALTVLFVPWRFARQVVTRASAGHAAIFAAACFLGPVASLLLERDSNIVATWLSTAVIYIGLQAVLFVVLDVPNWRHPLRSVRFWLIVGCYTSAVMLTEFHYGPPPLSAESWSHFLRGWPETLGNLVRDFGAPSAAILCQMLLWSTGLALCYGQRLRRARVRRSWAVVGGVAAGLLTQALYAVTYDQVGVRLWEFFDRWF